MQTIEQRAMEWLMVNDTGTSSKAILGTMMGLPCANDIPYDADDFGRCLRLLEKIPEWRARMPEMADKWLMWGPLVEAWEELESMYRRKDWKTLCERMRELRDQCRLAAGWTRTGPTSWKSPANETVVTMGNCAGGVVELRAKC